MAQLDGLADVALSLIDSFGINGTFTVPTGQTYNPATGATAQTNPTEIHKVTPPSVLSSREYGYVDNESSLVCYIAAKGLTLPENKNGIKLTIGTQKYEILSFEAIYSGDLIAVYMLRLRK